MRIGIISTFPLIECGIGTYTSYLVEKLRKLHIEVYIVSQIGAGGEKVYPALNDFKYAMRPVGNMKACYNA